MNLVLQTVYSPSIVVLQLSEFAPHILDFLVNALSGYDPFLTYRRGNGE